MAKRPYDSTHRQAQARATRQRIVVAATLLFQERGYAATSIAAVADAAGVAPQTVQAAFGSKAALLGEAVATALTGDDEPVAVIDRPDSRALLEVTDPETAADSFSRAVTEILLRAGKLIYAADAAADGDEALDDLRRAGHRGRLTDMRTTAEAFRRNGLLRADLTADAAADLLWLLTSPDAFRAFTLHRGWSAEQFERWLADTLRRMIFV
ncbi:MAG: TetR family transcriptional regulator [Microthrixaceae bacterium]